MPEEENPDFKYIVRMAETDLAGEDKVEVALAHIKGVGVRLGGIIADRAGVPRYKRIGDVSDDEEQALREHVDKIAEIAPPWMYNRNKDVETGEDGHLYGSELDMRLRDDLNRLKKIRSYRGIRHETGQKVRGQRTRANGRSGLAMGVQRKKE